MSYNDEHSPNQNFQTNKACTSLFRIYMHLFKNVQKQPIEVFCEKKRLRHRCFPVNFAKNLRTAFLKKTSGGCLSTCISLKNLVFLS